MITKEQKDVYIQKRQELNALLNQQKNMLTQIISLDKYKDNQKFKDMFDRCSRLIEINDKVVVHLQENYNNDKLFEEKIIKANAIDALINTFSYQNNKLSNYLK